MRLERSELVALIITAILTAVFIAMLLLLTTQPHQATSMLFPNGREASDMGRGTRFASTCSDHNPPIPDGCHRDTVREFKKET